jgi:prefoldin subunit 5
VTGPDPGRLLLDKIEAREQALAREAEQARTMIEDLAARVRELDEAIDHLRITRKTLLSLAGEPATEPAEPSPVLPGNPACQ